MTENQVAEQHAMTNMTQLPLVITQASLNQTALDYPRNMENIFQAIREAAANGSDLLTLEELALTGYEVNDDFQKISNDKIIGCLQDIADYAASLDPNLIISIGHPYRLQMREAFAEGSGSDPDAAKDVLYNRLGKPFNVQTMISGGKILNMTAKQNLFNDERGYEHRYFQEWSVAEANKVGGTNGTILVDVAGDRVPFGRPVLKVEAEDGRRLYLAHAICEEKWVASRFDYGVDAADEADAYDKLNVIPWTQRDLLGGEKDGFVLVVANASPPTPGKQDKHEHLSKLASDYADVVIDTDGIGTSGSTFAQFGHRFVVQDGQVIANSDRLSVKRVATTVSVATVSSAPQSVQGSYVTEISHKFKDVAPKIEAPAQTWDRADNEHRLEEEAIRMAALWLYDYIRKTKVQGVAEALSGGKDSAFNTTMYAVAIEVAIDELGFKGFMQDMKHLRCHDKALEIAASQGEEAAIDFVKYETLTGVTMPTQNNSDETKDAARILIEGGHDPISGQDVRGIGGKFMTRSVQTLLDTYALSYALEDLDDIAFVRQEELKERITAYLNRKPTEVTLQELEREAEGIIADFPEVESLISAADPKTSVAYENIQARAREVIILMIANTEAKLAIANPNLTEACNSYATFGGDLHSGTVGLNAFVHKDDQVLYMQYLYDHGLKGKDGRQVVKPVKALGPTLENEASAELLPTGKDGEVVQYDEDALRGSMEQLHWMADSMLWDRKVEADGVRRLTPREIFKKAQNDGLFTGVSDEKLFDQMMFRNRAWSLSQFKIHASTIAPTYGRSVDHQTSLRTPNLSGFDRDEMVLLGIEMLYTYAEDEGHDLGGRRVLERRAVQDSDFVAQFYSLVYNSDPNAEAVYDIKRLYNMLKTEGVDNIFDPLPLDHPVMVLSRIEEQKQSALGAISPS